MTEQDNPQIIHTRAWINDFIIKYNICPFARSEVESDRVRYRSIDESDSHHCLEELILECDYLDNHPETETTLLIFSCNIISFEDFLDFVDIAEQLLIAHDYEGVYQLASFHPVYRFADTADDDPANYTNRSPYPMLHIIREASIEKALQNYPNPETIPEQNIKRVRELGEEKLKALLANCLQATKPS